MRLKQYAAVIAATAFGAVSLPASATTLEREDFSAMVDKAAVIALGTVTSAEAATVNGERVTKFTFTADQIAAGEPGATFVVASPGGQISNAKVRMGEVHPGAPAFSKGASALLLLKEGADGAYQVIGYNQGLYQVFDIDGVDYVDLPDGDPITADAAIEKIRGLRKGQVD